MVLRYFNGSCNVGVNEYYLEIENGWYFIRTSKTNEYLNCHENEKHVYLSPNSKSKYLTNADNVLFSELGTKLWIDHEGMVWQHTHLDNTFTFTNTSNCNRCVKMLSDRFKFDMDAGIRLVNVEHERTDDTNNESPCNFMADIIRTQVEREALENKQWSGSSFESIQTLKCNNVGNVGEHLVKKLCDVNKDITYVYEGTNNKNNENGTFDILIQDFRVECKTARLGKHGSFQHESIRRNGCDFLLFIDICPKYYYITILKKMSFEDIRSLTGRKPHPRKGTSDVFKLDFSEPILKKLVQSTHAIRVCNETTVNDLNDFFILHFKNP